MVQKIVINRRYGGFGLSDQALEFLGMSDSYTGDIPRDNDRLISLIEEKGASWCNGPYADLAIVEIPDEVEWVICEHDGFEHIAEAHRTWGY